MGEEVPDNVLKAKALAELHILRDSEGFSALSSARQQLVVDSLTQAVNETSVDHSICHSAVRAFEQELPFDVVALSQRMSESVYAQADYIAQENPTLDLVLRKVEETGLPCVVIISALGADLDQDIMAPKLYHRPLHSFIALYGENNQIITWEKQGAGRAYRRSTLEELYARYAPVQGFEGARVTWGTRSIPKSS